MTMKMDLCSRCRRRREQHPSGLCWECRRHPPDKAQLGTVKNIHARSQARVDHGGISLAVELLDLEEELQEKEYRIACYAEQVEEWERQQTPPRLRILRPVYRSLSLTYRPDNRFDHDEEEDA